MGDLRVIDTIKGTQPLIARFKITHQGETRDHSIRPAKTREEIIEA